MSSYAQALIALCVAFLLFMLPIWLALWERPGMEDLPQIPLEWEG